MQDNEIWEVEATDAFADWWGELNNNERESVGLYIKMLMQFGVKLGYPYTSQILGSQYGKMRELRIQHNGEPYRVFYAFDPRRSAILLIGAIKSGKEKRFYEQYVPIADALYKQHLDSLEK